MLGKMLYADYWSKLFGTNMLYNQSKFYFKSTDVNRTIESIQSQLLGIFENVQSVNISNNDLGLSLPAWNHTLTRSSGTCLLIKDMCSSRVLFSTHCPSTLRKER